MTFIGKKTVTKARQRIMIGLIVLLTVTAYVRFVDAETNSPSAFTSAQYQLNGGHVQFGSPTLADLTGDGVPEVLIGTTSCSYNPCNANQPAVLEVWYGNGTRYWSRDVGGPINSAPSVADIDADGQPEIVVSIGGAVDDSNQNGGVVAYERDGTEKWRFNTLDSYPVDGHGEGVFSGPTLCDIEGDGDMEISFGAWDMRIYLLDHNGNSLWQNSPGVATGPGYHNADTSWSTAACADLNGDDFKEIIIGADITGGGILPDGTPTTDGGFLYIFDRYGDEPLVRRYLPEAIYSSPAVGDLDGDGDLEIVVGTGWFWWNQHGRTSQPYVYAFDTANVFGSLSYDNANKLPHLPGWPRPTTYPGFSSPALADLDGDTDLEVVIGTGHPDLANDQIAGAGQLYAWHHDGSLVAGWPISPKNANGNDAPIFSSPTIADVDADGGLEILFSMLWDVQIYNANGAFQERLPTDWTVWGSPAVGDTNGDGNIEIWIGGGMQWFPESGFLYRFENGAADLGNHPWPMFRSNAAQTALLNNMAPRMDAGISSSSLLYELGSNETQTFQLQLQNTGGGPYDWNIEDLPSWLHVTPGTGTLDAFSTTTLSVEVDAGNLSLGTHQGNVVINATENGDSVAGSPITIPVTLTVVQDVYQARLPLIVR